MAEVAQHEAFTPRAGGVIFPQQNGSGCILDYWNIKGPLHFQGTSASSIGPVTAVNADLPTRDITPYDPSRHSGDYVVSVPINVSARDIWRGERLQHATAHAKIYSFTVLFVATGGQGFGHNIAVLRPPEVKSPHSFPPDIKKQLERLRDTSGNEDILYAIADAVAAWLPEGTEEQQTALVAYLTELSPLKIRILLSALADAEVKLTSTSLLRAVREYLYIQNKRCAQAAAGCLLVCGGAFGRILLQEALQNPTMIPHARLIQGIFDLLVLW